MRRLMIIAPVKAELYEGMERVETEHCSASPFISFSAMAFWSYFSVEVLKIRQLIDQIERMAITITSAPSSHIVVGIVDIDDCLWQREGDQILATFLVLSLGFHRYRLQFE
jgi:phenylpyruvate tautomerase PptA (4-oxalocrotonate tautomerase family)